MKISFLLLVLTVLNAYATNIFSQNARISADMQNVTVREVVSEIERQGGINFLFNDNLAGLSQRVSVSFNGQPIKDVLESVLSQADMTYEEIKDDFVVLLSKPDYLKQQENTVTGRVTDERTGNPIPGVSVFIKGTQIGTITDTNGEYALENISSDQTLVFSFVGMLTQEIDVDSQTVIDVIMTEDLIGLDEVVVVGYGTQYRRDLTGSVGSMSSDDIRDLPVSRIEEALLGRIAGVMVKPSTGGPGAQPEIFIRGIGSISAGNAPLFVVDGYPSGNIQMINPNDIESIDVLKDASASAIYGSRGANGVILITTKRGKAGEAKINFEMKTGVQQVTNTMKMMNAKEQAQFYFDGVRNRNLDEGRDISGPPNEWRRSVPQTILDVLDGTNTYDTDWFDEVFRIAPMQQYNLSASGGTESFRYSISGEYFDQDGIILNTSFKRYSLRANFDAELSPRINLRLNLAPSFTDKHNLPIPKDVMDGVIDGSNYWPVYNEDGTYFAQYGLDAQANQQNPVALAKEFSSSRKQFNHMGNFNLEYAIFDELKANILLGAYADNYKRSDFKPDLGAVFRDAPPTGSDYTYFNINWLTEYTLTFNKTFGRHSVNAITGFTAQKDTYENNSLASNKYPNNLVQTLSAVGNLIDNGTSGITEWTLLSYLGRVNYVNSGKYYLTASIRRDGSSRFGGERKWGLFPSIALAWRISEENFMKGIEQISSFKLRASYGESGNNNIGNYAHIPTISYTNYVFGNTSVGGYAPGRIDNPYLTWEKQQQFNGGLDIGLFRNRIQISVDYFNAVNKDLLLNVNIPDITGYNTALQNMGEVKNVGWDFSLNTVNLDGRFRWTTDFIISVYKNEVLKLGPEGDPIYGNAWNANSHITKIGQPIGMFYGWLTDGVFMNQAELDAGPIFNPGASDRSRVGDIRFVDVDGDGIITANDKTIMGNPHPDYYFGLTNYFSYRGFTFLVQVQGSQGADILHGRRFYIANTRGRYNQLASLNDYWKSEEEPGNGKIPRPNDSPTGNNRNRYSQFHTDTGSYIRINNIALSYQVPFNLVGRAGLENAKIYISSQNPFTFTKYQGFNPDVSSLTNPLTPNADLNVYPLARSIVLGLNIGF